MSEDVERISRIETLVSEMLMQIRIGSLGALREAPAKGEWSATQILAHVAEFVPFWAGQARWLSEREQEKTPFGRSSADPEQDPERLDAIERYGSYSRSGVVDLIQKGLAQAVADIGAIQPEGWTHAGQHVNGQVRTVAQVVDELLIEHLEAHVQQMEQTLMEDDD